MLLPLRGCPLRRDGVGLRIVVCGEKGANQYLRRSCRGDGDSLQFSPPEEKYAVNCESQQEDYGHRDPGQMIPNGLRMIHIDHGDVDEALCWPKEGDRHAKGFIRNGWWFARAEGPTYRLYCSSSSDTIFVLISWMFSAWSLGPTPGIRGAFSVTGAVSGCSFAYWTCSSSVVAISWSVFRRSSTSLDVNWMPLNDKAKKD